MCLRFLNFLMYCLHFKIQDLKCLLFIRVHLFRVYIDTEKGPTKCCFYVVQTFYLEHCVKVGEVVEGGAVELDHLAVVSALLRLGNLLQELLLALPEPRIAGLTGVGRQLGLETPTPGGVQGTALRGRMSAYHLHRGI